MEHLEGLGGRIEFFTPSALEVFRTLISSTFSNGEFPIIDNPLLPLDDSSSSTKFTSISPPPTFQAISNDILELKFVT